MSRQEEIRLYIGAPVDIKSKNRIVQEMSLIDNKNGREIIEAYFDTKPGNFHYGISWSTPGLSLDQSLFLIENCLSKFEADYPKGVTTFTAERIDPSGEGKRDATKLDDGIIVWDNSREQKEIELPLERPLSAASLLQATKGKLTNARINTPIADFTLVPNKELGFLSNIQELNGFTSLVIQSNLSPLSEEKVLDLFNGLKERIHSVLNPVPGGVC